MHKIKEFDQVRVVPMMASSKNEVCLLARSFNDATKYVVGEMLDQGVRIIGYPLVLVPHECVWPWEDDNGD